MNPAEQIEALRENAALWKARAEAGAPSGDSDERVKQMKKKLRVETERADENEAKFSELKDNFLALRERYTKARQEVKELKTALASASQEKPKKERKRRVDEDGNPLPPKVKNCGRCGVSYTQAFCPSEFCVTERKAMRAASRAANEEKKTRGTP